MTDATWRFEDADTLAAYLPLDDFRALLQRRIAISPDQVGILIRDGRIVDTYQGAHFAIGGLWNRLKECFGGRHALQLLVADLKPFQLEAEMRGYSAEHTALGATVRLELQLDPERPVNLLGLVTPYRPLTRQDIYQRLQPYLQERVFQPALSRVSALEVRGDAALQQRIESDARQMVAQLAADLGLRLRSLVFSWALNADELAALEQRDQTRRDEMTEFEFRRSLRALEREQEGTVLELRHSQALEQLQAAGQADLEQLLQQRQLELADARSNAERLESRKQLAHDLDLARQRWQASHEQALAAAGTQLQRQKLELEGRRLEVEFASFQRQEALRLRKLEAEQARADQRATQNDELDTAERSRQQQLQALRELQDLELAKTRSQHELARDDQLLQHSTAMERERERSTFELEKLRLQGTMNPDQILAIQAGLSPEVARVFAERARTDAAAAADKESLLREMVKLSETHKVASEEQARSMFDSALKNMAAVAGARSPAAATPAADDPPPTTVECPHCHHQVPLGDRFCKVCGQQLRT